MFERSEPVLRIICVALAALLLFQLSRVVLRSDPLKNLAIPAVPTLAANAEGGGKGTNAATPKMTVMAGTNAASHPDSDKRGTNAVPHLDAAKTNTNGAATNEPAGTGTNAVHQESNKPGTNSIVRKEGGKIDTNAAANLESGKTGTNVAAQKKSGKSETNAVMNSAVHPPPGMGGMNFMPGQGPGGSPVDLPPLIKARVDRIVQSEILGQVIKPMPMALLGIAGKDVFFRAPSGQTGLVKEGDELGGVKILRIGMNRILVEQDGEKKELTIFSGFGSETLLPKQEKNPNETITKTP
jgi:hypothetical protein